MKGKEIHIPIGEKFMDAPVEKEFILDTQDRFQSILDNDPILEDRSFDDIDDLYDYVTKRLASDFRSFSLTKEYPKDDKGLRGVRFDLQVPFEEGIKIVEFVGVANFFGKGYTTQREHAEPLAFPIIYCKDITIKD